tara:strand:- start:253 stop:1041 length:789 start_codon:yes stop_codon:yes gene_type:complete
MKILFIGDIVGKSGRDALSKNLDFLKNKYNPEAIIVNAENAVSGYGLNEKISKEIFELGVDVITLGNHAWDQKEMLSYIEKKPNIIRAINYPSGVPGKGEFIIKFEDGRTLIVIQTMLRLFINISLDDPFSVIKNRLSSEYLGTTCNAILIDMHGEATSEKNAFAHYVDGKVTAVLGTHTHIPTSDARILKNGTAYQTDVGMTGDYDSVIGSEKEGPIHAFVKGFRSEGRFRPASGQGLVSGAFIESNDKTGLAEKIESFQL